MKRIYFISVILFISTMGCYQNPCLGTSTVDYAGKTYNTVQVGNQCWLKENLNVGMIIDSLADQTNNGKIEKYCYRNDTAYCTTYGGLYEWAEAVQYKNGATDTTLTNPPLTGKTQGICPIGWHIPSFAELQTLATTVNNDGNALKAVGQGTLSADGDGRGTNTSGFSALLSGYRYYSGHFNLLGTFTFFWSTEDTATKALHVYLHNYDSAISFPTNNKEYGFSVRCVKDF